MNFSDDTKSRNVICSFCGKRGDQVKRMLASRGKPVRSLRRLSEGELELGENLGPGGIRELDEEDLCKVLRDFGIGK